jgi:hypothetical protein
MRDLAPDMRSLVAFVDPLADRGHTVTELFARRLIQRGVDVFPDMLGDVTHGPSGLARGGSNDLAIDIEDKHNVGHCTHKPEHKIGLESGQGSGVEHSQSIVRHELPCLLRRSIGPDEARAGVTEPRSSMLDAQ